MKNITSIRIKFLGATNTKPARASITQTNNCKRMIWTPDSMSSRDYSKQAHDLIEAITEGQCFEIVDNTQQHTMQFAVIGGSSFPDYIKLIKEARQNEYS